MRTLLCARPYRFALVTGPALADVGTRTDFATY